MGTPLFVTHGDHRARWTAAVTAARAYGTGPVAILVSAVFAAITTVGVWVEGEWVGVPLSSLGALVVFGASWVLMFAVWVTSIGIFVFRAPTKKRLYLLDNEKTRSVAVIEPASSRDSLPDDVKVSFLAAVPKRSGAGRELGEWIREVEHAAGNRVTGTTTRLLLAKYLAAGMVVDGKQGWFLTRIASRSR